VLISYIIKLLYFTMSTQWDSFVSPLSILRNLKKENHTWIPHIQYLQYMQASIRCCTGVRLELQHFFWQAGAGVAELSPSSDWIRMKRNVIAKFWINSIGYKSWQYRICWKYIYNDLKSYLLCQTISPFSATANEIAISHYVCDLSYHRNSCKSQAS
jgi:hypothetical protein